MRLLGLARLAVLILKLFQDTDGLEIARDLLLRAANTDLVMRLNAEIAPRRRAQPFGSL